jgi:hypothetical protein
MNKRNKPAKLKEVKGAISADDISQIEAIYKIRSQLVNGVYLTPLMHAKSTVVRITFSEHNFTLNKQIPVVAVSMTIEDVQNVYNAMTELLQQMRALGRIE